MLCLAEALLRIPDAETVDRLIRDKLGEADWARHLGHSDSIFVNASTWALMLTGRLLRAEPARDLRAALQRFALRSGEPVVRQAVTAAMRILARQFVMGRTIEEALDRARAPNAKATVTPTTCWAKRRIPLPMRRAISPPMSTRSPRSGRPRRVARSKPHPESQSNCPRCTRVTRWRSANACWPRWPHAYWRSPGGRGRPASGLRSMQKRPTGSICRSI